MRDGTKNTFKYAVLLQEEWSDLLWELIMSDYCAVMVYVCVLEGVSAMFSVKCFDLF